MYGMDKEERTQLPRWEKDYHLQVNTQLLLIFYRANSFRKSPTIGFTSGKAI